MQYKNQNLFLEGRVNQFFKNASNATTKSREVAGQPDAGRTKSVTIDPINYILIPLEALTWKNCPENVSCILGVCNGAFHSAIGKAGGALASRRGGEESIQARKSEKSRFTEKTETVV
jgi:hypothetical protein